MSTTRAVKKSRKTTYPEEVLRPIPTGHEIVAFMHCGKCIKEWRDGKAPGESPSAYARIEAGFTKVGIQLRCVRHDINIIHIDFDGAKHRANTEGA